ncbi:CD63 antigen-like [Harpegnathos saltator]|uniref:CD63 antigen-like n=1 Tax=Harpegnathos saltator TaxID=610380 RepID=UPI000DBEE390|nr:CD63 antigen-like [Harpegnathos saltator]
MMALTVLEDSVQRSVLRWIRTFYILCNLILAFLGIGGLALAIISKINMFGELTLLHHYQNIEVDIFLACSTILIVIGCLGIFAGSRNCYKLMLTNGLLLGAFLICTIAYIVTTNIITDYKNILLRQMSKDMNNYKKNIVDKLHVKLSCCGLHDITTWNANNIPTSCCRNIKTKCVLGSPYLKTNGCFEEFIRMSRYYVWLFYSVFTSVGLIEIFGIMLSYLQCGIIKDTQKKKCATDDLKIPRPQMTSVHVEKETQVSEEEKGEEKEEKGKGEEEKGTKKEEEDKEEKEKEESNKENNAKETKQKTSDNQDIVLEHVNINEIFDA